MTTNQVYASSSLAERTICIRSSAWIEQQFAELKVGGSNPSGCATLKKRMMVMNSESQPTNHQRRQHVCLARDGRRPGPRTVVWRGQRASIHYPCTDATCPSRQLRRPELLRSVA